MSLQLKIQKIIIIKRNDNFLWSWEESAAKKVFGVANNIDEIKRRANKMFPDCKLSFCVQ